jgi:Polyketide cyclase / dehydrase and lipid transport
LRIIKLAFISFIFFSLLITGISLFIPSRIRISKAIDINAPKDSVMSQISDAAKWKNWYPGADSLEFVYMNGKVMGIGKDSMRGLIITAVKDSSVLAAYTGLHVKRSETGWNIIGGNNPGSVIVQWYMDFHLRWYPWEKFSSLLLEKRYGPQLEQGLANLKTLLEK